MILLLRVCVAGQGLYSSSVHAVTGIFLSWSHVHLKALVLSLEMHQIGLWRAVPEVFLEAVLCSSELHRR